ncbi:MAG: hypothetical protein NUV82_03110 [Candidatus Komeilibacteria bacterium]|nr:hypothetical protein [Candidatus Komeilibacteria bacterium]
MYIYINNLNKALPDINTGSETVQENVVISSVSVGDDDILQEDVLRDVFVKATIFKYNKYPKKREYGIYTLGKATAELVPSGKEYHLRIETDTLEGVKDMKEIQRRIWAGKIVPTISYEKEQVGRIRGFFPKLYAAWRKFVGELDSLANASGL